MKKMSKEKKNIEKQLADSIVKGDSYFEIIQKKDKELLEVCKLQYFQNEHSWLVKWLSYIFTFSQKTTFLD